MFDAHPSDVRRQLYLPVYKFSPRRPVHVLCCSVLEGLYTHYVGRTRACPGPAICRLCQVGRTQRYQGYFAAIIERRRWLVRLSAPTALALMASPPSPGRIYRLTQTALRRPLEIFQESESRVPEGQEVSESELLQILMGLHGLGLPDGSTRPDDLRRLALERACALIDREALVA